RCRFVLAVTGGWVHHRFPSCCGSLAPSPQFLARLLAAATWIRQGRSLVGDKMAGKIQCRRTCELGWPVVWRGRSAPHRHGLTDLLRHLEQRSLSTAVSAGRAAVAGVATDSGVVH